MKKDIKFLPVEGVFVVVARDFSEINEPFWNVYLINRNKAPLTNVFVTSKGYGKHKEKDEEQKTSVLRHHFPEIAANEYALIEPIDPGVFHLTNEYWVSYFINNQIFDKKFIFVPDSVQEENLIPIRELGLDGILHS